MFVSLFSIRLPLIRLQLDPVVDERVTTRVVSNGSTTDITTKTNQHFTLTLRLCVRNDLYIKAQIQA